MGDRLEELDYLVDKGKEYANSKCNLPVKESKGVLVKKVSFSLKLISHLIRIVLTLLMDSGLHATRMRWNRARSCFGYGSRHDDGIAVLQGYSMH